MKDIINFGGWGFTPRAVVVYTQNTVEDFYHPTRETLLWRSRGRVLTMDDIDDDHLLNIVRFFEGRGDGEHPMAHSPIMRHIYGLFLTEVERRELTPHTRSTADAIARHHDRMQDVYNSRLERVPWPVYDDGGDTGATGDRVSNQSP